VLLSFWRDERAGLARRRRSWLPGTQYPPDDAHPQLAYSDLTGWIGALLRWPEYLSGSKTSQRLGPPLGTRTFTLPLPSSLRPSGQSVVIEFLDGQRKSAGRTGTTTHVRRRAHQLADVRLASRQPRKLIQPQRDRAGDVGVVLGRPPVGNGLCGMPGDPSRPSRFVRAALMLKGFLLLPAQR